MSTVYNAYCRVFQSVFKIVLGTELMNWKEPELYEGPGSVLKLPARIKELGIRKVLVVTDKNLMSLGLPAPFLAGLTDCGVEYAVFDDVLPNPSVEIVEKAKQAYVENHCEALVAFGGGSPMDTAKCAGALYVNPGKTVQKLWGLMHAPRKLPPLFAIPTTAGTGSEVTLASVITDEATHEKRVIMDQHIRPGYAVLDPELTVSLPADMTAATGMDALTHAIEAYIGNYNVKNTPEYAVSAIKLIFENLYNAYTDGSDLNARMNMLKAAYDAGMAFTRACCGYVHAIGHNLGGFYHVPHGWTMAIILPHMLDFFGDKAYYKLARLSEATNTKTDGTDEEKAKAFIEAIRELNRKMGIPEGFTCIKEEDIPTIADRALLEGNPMYPVPRLMDKNACMEIIKGLRI